MGRLRITELFFSLQGETRTVGLPTVFIRLTGCPLRCQYCDTAYAFHGGTWWSIESILAQVSHYTTKYVTVTGGEPLAQPDCLLLLQKLCDLGLEVSLETSGALDVALVDPRVVKVIDIKSPGSGEAHRNLLTNFDFLLPHDQIKFVVCSRSDYDWCKKMMKDHHLAGRCEILFSPSYTQQPAGDLADWILQDGLQARLQVQLHKYLWGDVAGR